ncbi:MAG: hypothetical protein ABIH66_13530 [bacterium]
MKASAFLKENSNLGEFFILAKKGIHFASCVIPAKAGIHSLISIVRKIYLFLIDLAGRGILPVPRPAARDGVGALQPKR